MQSPPSRRRGLKSYVKYNSNTDNIVASLAEARIEISDAEMVGPGFEVASLAEARIEIVIHYTSL